MIWNIKVKSRDLSDLSNQALQLALVGELRIASPDLLLMTMPLPHLNRIPYCDRASPASRAPCLRLALPR